MLIGVAVKHGDLVIGLPAPNRHHNVIRYMVDELGIKPPVGTDGQGFYDDMGKYYTREAAYVHALNSGQYIMGSCPGMRLYSENLW